MVRVRVRVRVRVKVRVRVRVRVLASPGPWRNYPSAACGSACVEKVGVKGLG